MRRWPWAVGRSLAPIVVAAALAALRSVVAVGQVGAPPSAQDGAQPAPTFRGGVEAVVVDVYVTDKDGNPVRNLTVDDFDVFENGRSQSITTFANVDIPLQRNEQFWPDAEPDVATNTNPPGRTYMIILDGHLDADKALRTRHVLRQFFEKHFGDNDLATIVTGWGLATDGQDFTNNRRLLIAALDKFSGEGRGPKYLQDLQERMEFFARMPGQRKAVLWITDEIGFDPYDIIDYQGGVVSLDREYAHSAMAAATRGNIRVYPISPVLLTDGSDFRALARLTGGFAHTSADFSYAFQRLFQETSTYYVIGFNSSQARKSGRYVKFEVKVQRPGLEVRARPGIVAPLDYVRRRQKSEKPQSPVAAALGTPVAVAEVPMRVAAASFRDRGSNATVVLTLDVEPTGLQFIEKDGQFEARLEIRHLATDTRNKLYPEFQHPATLTVSRAVHQRISANGLRVLSEFGMPPGRYQLRVASAGAVKAGSVVYDLEVPDFRGASLTMSGVVLTSERAADVFTMQADAGDRFSKPKECRPPVCVAEVRKGRAMLAWPSQSPKTPSVWRDALQTPPTTTRDFASSDTLTAFVEVYDNGEPRVDGLPYAIEATTTLRDVKGASVRTIALQKPSNSPRRPSGGYPFVMSIPLADIIPGPYLLQVDASAARDSEHTVNRRIPIHIH